MSLIYVLNALGTYKFGEILLRLFLVEPHNNLDFLSPHPLFHHESQGIQAALYKHSWNSLSGRLGLQTSEQLEVDLLLEIKEK